MKKLISIVTPFYNEEDALADYFSSLEEVLAKIDEIDFEFIAIDDGSIDKTFAILKEIAATKKNLKVIKLSRNFGKDIALTAGLDHAGGDAVIPFDADLQDSPQVISLMIKKWFEGYKIVLAKRSSRQDPWLKKFTATLFYKLAAKIMDRTLPQNVGDFRLIDKSALNDIKKLRERNRFTRGILSWVGYSTTTIEYERNARFKGTTKYNYFSLIKYAFDGIFSFSTFPIRLITYCGLIISCCSFIYGLVIIFQKIFSNQAVPGYSSIMSVILFLGGINFIFIGVIGEYIGRIFNEVKERPLYLIEEIINN
ncbi:MAG: glycosyltransferase family 2 protein [Rickettsiales bacterium]|nr:glycosyltransferase family 2 protein [Rickettsiales bacterium]